MHELPVTESILEISIRHARQADAHRIADIYLVIGQLSSIVDDSIQFYWDIIAKETMAEGACLHFRRIPAEFACLDCGSQFHINGEDYFCPNCHGVSVKVISGEEFYLEAIEVEKENGKS
jgi:hydrogenase nickel incorporation protein HypA/HybF